MGDTFVFDPKATPEERAKLLRDTVEDGPITKWSFSALQTFESCPFRLFVKRIKGVKEPSSEAMTRGNEIHDLAESYVRGQILELPKELEKFEDEFIKLRDEFADGNVECEENWGFDKEWQVTESWYDKNTWAMIKLDAFVREDDLSATVIDYKTGKKWGNELKHGQQGITYVIAAFARYPELEVIEYQFWYLDKGETLSKRFNRKQIGLIAPRFNQRALALTQATEFPPTPSKTNCKWCPNKDNGECDYAEK